MQPSNTGPGFHYVALRATDFDGTVRFCTEGLGFTIRHEFAVDGRIDRAAFLDTGDGRYLEVFGPGSTVQSEGRRRRPEAERTEGAMLHFCLRVPTPMRPMRALSRPAASRASTPELPSWVRIR